jgi:hypothetical protein
VKRAALNLCAYPKCKAKPLDDNNECERHRDEHRLRNRRWWNFRARQLTLDLSSFNKASTVSSD